MLLNVSADWLSGNIILSTEVCGTCFAEPDTILVFTIFYGVFGGRTRLAMPKTNMRAGHIVIESLVQGLLMESWIRGSPDSRTIYFGRIVGLRRYKIEDFVPCPDGTLLCVEGKLGDSDM